MNRTETARPSKFAMAMVWGALVVCGLRIATVTSRDGTTAFLSANDRSRWSMIASLVERGTYEIDDQIAITDPIMRNRRPWDAIDKVRHTNRDGQLRYYSSKPPLFPTVVAGVYWIVHQISGVTMTDHPKTIPRIVLAMVNLPLLWIFLISMVDIIHRIARNRWAQTTATGASALGTMVLPFSISLGNHLPAAVATAVTACLYFRLQDTASPRRFSTAGCELLAGMTAALTFTNELPALSMLAGWVWLFGARRWVTPRPSTLVCFLCGVAIVLVAFFGTNWIAHNSLRPPYAHRGNGPAIAKLATTAPPQSDEVIAEIKTAIAEKWGTAPLDAGPLDQPAAVTIKPSDEPDRWQIHTPKMLLGLLWTGQRYEIRHWDDWYEYPGSYWQQGRRRGIDLGEPSRGTYLFHMTLGHHGIFSLTPIWLLMPIGFVLALRGDRSDIRRLAAICLLATAVCMAFYVARPEIDRNYGGVSACFRWLLWFAPLWLIMVTITLDRQSHRRGFRVVAIVLLALSVASMSTALSSPWQHPWLYRLDSFWAG